ncbi:MAG: tyrosine-type recombinase/integrase [Chloroflexi bacterium]|nr:tyrosine-type recombinase/integrase [Chloroflexota bacterium]
MQQGAEPTREGVRSIPPSRQLGWDLAPHDPRRTFAKLARSGQAPLEQIQPALGHQSIQTTQRYLVERSSGATTAWTTPLPSS